MGKYLDPKSDIVFKKIFYEYYWKTVSSEKTLIFANQKKGREKGIKETAMKVKAAGISTAVISECAGLTEEQIKAL